MNENMNEDMIEEYDNPNEVPTQTDENPIEIFNNLYKPKLITYEKCPDNYDFSNFKIQGYNANDIKNDTLYCKIMASYAIYSHYCRFYSIKKVKITICRTMSNNNHFMIFILINYLIANNRRNCFSVPS